MNGKLKKDAVVIFAIFILGGFFFPLLFVGAVITGWVMIEDWKNVSNKNDSASLSQPDAGSDWSVHELLDSTSRAVDNVNSYLSVAAIVQEYMTTPQRIFNTEKIVIDAAVEMAVSEIRIENLKAHNADYRRHYEKAYAELKLALDSQNNAKEIYKLEVLPMVAPSTHPDPATNDAIQAAYLDMLDERSQYFAAVKRQMKRDRRMPDLMRCYFVEHGHTLCWDAISC
jgi:hypothetical protein